jgi:senataxin
MDLPCNDGGFSVESCPPKSESNGDINSVQPAKNRKVNGDSDFSVDTHLPPIQKQSTWKQPAESSWKHPADLRQPKNSQFSNRKPALINQGSMDSKLGNKKYLPVKKSTVASTPYQDTSVERLIREVTNEKFWHHPGIKQNIYMSQFVYVYMHYL